MGGKDTSPMNPIFILLYIYIYIYMLYTFYYVYIYTLSETNSSHLKVGRNPKGKDRLPTNIFF